MEMFHIMFCRIREYVLFPIIHWNAANAKDIPTSFSEYFSQK